LKIEATATTMKTMTTTTTATAVEKIRKTGEEDEGRQYIKDRESMDRSNTGPASVE